MSNPGEQETTYGRWPDDDQRKGKRRRDVQAAASRGLRQGRDQLSGISERAALAGLAGRDRLTRGGKPGRGSRGGRGGGGEGERAMVPEAHFTSYYGRQVVKPAPWKADIPAYFFLGGAAAGSSLLGAGADLTGRPALRRAGRLGALAGISLSMAALVHDLGRPSRFLNMQRVIRPTSPMSVGTWILSLYGPLAGFAAVSEMADAAGLTARLPGALRGPARLLSVIGRPSGIGAALVAPAVASYTAVLLSDTATPTWHDAHQHLPFFFVGSAAAASGGLGMVSSPVNQAGPARRMAIGGVLLEFATDQRMEAAMGLTAEPLHEGKAGTYLRIAKGLNVIGAGAALLGRRSRAISVVSGTALLLGSAFTRFGIFEAGQQSAIDPKYTVVPQRERLDAQKRVNQAESLDQLEATNQMT